MGGRIDDVSKFMWKNIKRHHNDKISPYAFLSKLCWSKNVHEERDTPYQIQFGAINSKHCATHTMLLFKE